VTGDRGQVIGEREEKGLGDREQVTGKREEGRGKRRGFFITLEGVEGAGKSTLGELLRNRIASDGTEVVLTAEPGGDVVAERIRKLVLDSVNVITDRAELLLFEAARAQHVDNVILPALARGSVVICDRFTDSSIAYQGYARGIGAKTVQMLNDYATRGLKPDLTILLDISARVGLKRMRRTDRLSSEGIAFHIAVRDGYLSAAESEPDRFVVIDASKGVDEVLQIAMDAINNRFLPGE